MHKKLVAAIAIFAALLGCTKPATVIGTVPSNPVVPVTDTTAQPDTTTTPGRVYTYLALGDSYTIGQSVPQPDRYPVQTVAKLNTLNFTFDPPEIIAQTGWTTGSLLSVLSRTPPSKLTYDIVTLLIGVNNQYQGRTQQEYREEFTDLLEKSIQWAGGNKRRVVVLSIPDYSVTPFAAANNTAQIAAEINEFNAINKSIALQFGVNYLDITGYSRQASSDLTLLALDRLHPSGKMYGLWANELAPLIATLLR